MRPPVVAGDSSRVTNLLLASYYCCRCPWEGNIVGANGINTRQFWVGWPPFILLFIRGFSRSRLDGLLHLLCCSNIYTSLARHVWFQMMGTYLKHTDVCIISQQPWRMHKGGDGLDCDSVNRRFLMNVLLFIHHKQPANKQARGFGLTKKNTPI